MKAAIYEQYGAPEVLHITELEMPVPQDNEVLIKVHAATVSSGDWRARSLVMPAGFSKMGRLAFGVSGPRQPILGTELAGVIESAGQDVTQFKPGDEVFAFPGAKMGSYAEYKSMPADWRVEIKPPNLSFEEAAAISFGGTTALHFLRKGNIKEGEKVLVNGATGSVGSAAVQLAKHFGAGVTAVSGPSGQKLAESLGADRVIDYTKEDFTKNGEKYDVIVDTVGNASFKHSKDSLKTGGRLLMVLGGLSDLLTSPWISMTTDKKVIAGTAVVRPGDLKFLADLAMQGEFKPVIDREYTLEQIVEAHHYLDTGHKKGNVAVTMKHE